MKELAKQPARTTKSVREPRNLYLDSALLKDNADALASANAYVKANGLPLDQHRQF